jgi:DNA-binding IclR family transcriptional regulator
VGVRGQRLGTCLPDGIIGEQGRVAFDDLLRAGTGGNHQRIAIGEQFNMATGDAARRREVAGTVGRLAAAGLLRKVIDLAAGPAQQFEGRKTDRWTHQIDEAADKQGNTHNAMILQRTTGACQQRRSSYANKKKMTKTTQQEGAKSSIQVIERMMTLLDVLAATPEPASLKLLAQTTGLHPSTAHRILAAMTASRIVERQDAGTYRLGIRLLELGNLVKSRINIREVALPHMQHLHEQIGESVNLGIRHEDEIIYIERTSSGRSLVRVVYLVGGRAPLHLTSVGKLFLAADGADKVRDYAKRTGLPGKTAHSLATLPALEKELDWIRRHDVAYDNEEAEVGLRCVAAPIRDDEGKLIGGLSVSAPSERHSADWCALIKAAADNISHALGHRSAAR